VTICPSGPKPSWYGSFPQEKPGQPFTLPMNSDLVN
jgi:hypothetical protein